MNFSSNNYQVLRFEKFKIKDIGGLSVELKDRKGKGSYDLERTKFNTELKRQCSNNLLSSVYKTINDNNIDFNKSKKNINIINGCVVTSGQDFFKSLGMKFKETNKFYTEGENAGKPIEVPIINSINDIPKDVLTFFCESHDFLSKLVGEDNVINSVIHFDENTPHMHFYFIPVTNKIKRKVFETDKDGKQIYKTVINKNGISKKVPIQKKNIDGSLVYETLDGKFLNDDYFWKNQGAKNAYAKIQDSFNTYINSKGYDLNRGKVGLNKTHTDKAEKDYKELTSKNEILKKQIEELESEKYKQKREIQTLKDTNNKIIDDQNKIIQTNENKINLLSEVKLKKLSKENSLLKDENKNLKERISILEEFKSKAESFITFALDKLKDSKFIKLVTERYNDLFIKNKTLKEVETERKDFIKSILNDNKTISYNGNININNKLKESDEEFEIDL